MVTAKIIVREPGSAKLDYGLLFDFPELPRVGDYISIQRPDKQKPYGEDLIVRHVWWRLNHPETRGVVSDGQELTGSVNEVFVECDKAIGPWASDAWRDELEAACRRGVTVERFGVVRLSIRERELGGRIGTGPS